MPFIGAPEPVDADDVSIRVGDDDDDGDEEETEGELEDILTDLESPDLTK